MGSGTFEQKGGRRLAQGVLVAAVLVYAAVRIGFLCFSLQMASAASLRQAVDQYSGLLMAMDESLVLSAVLGGWAFYNACRSRVRSGRALTGLAVASFALMLIAWVVIVLMIAWAGSSCRPLWKHSGAAIGLAQILSTYFGQPVKPIPMLIAIALSTAWMLMRGVSSNNGLESEAVQEAE